MLFSVPAGSDVGGALVAVLVLLGIMFASAVWVYNDAKTSAGRGRPIVSSVGSFQLSTPVAWFFACLLMWELFFPYTSTAAAWPSKKLDQSARLPPRRSSTAKHFRCHAGGLP